MADIKLETVVDYILKAGKVDNTAEFQNSMNQVLGALIQKMDAPTAILDVPVHLQEAKLSAAEIRKFKESVKGQLAKISSEMHQVSGLPGADNKLKAKGLATAQSFFEGVQAAMDKIPPLKVGKQTRTDLEKVLADPLHVDEILKSKNGRDRLQKLRAYAQYIDDMRSEIASIHKKASTGTRMVVGSGDSFDIVNTMKMSLPDFGVVSQLTAKQLNEIKKATDQVNLAKREQKKLISSITDKAERNELKRQFSRVDGDLKNATPDIFDFRGVDDILSAQIKRTKAQISADRARDKPTAGLSDELKQLRNLQRDLRRRRSDAEGNSLALGFDKHLENARFAASKAISLLPADKNLSELSLRQQKDLSRYLSSAVRSSEHAYRLGGDEAKEREAAAVLHTVNALRDRVNLEKATTKEVEKRDKLVTEAQRRQNTVEVNRPEVYRDWAGIPVDSQRQLAEMRRFYERAAVEAEKGTKLIQDAKSKHRAGDLSKESTAREIVGISREDQAQLLRMRQFYKREAAAVQRERAEAIRASAEQVQSQLGKEAIDRVGGYNHSQLLSLDPHEQVNAAAYLKTRQAQIQNQQTELAKQMAVPGISTEHLAKLRAEHAKLGDELPRIKTALGFVNSEMKGLAGFTHQAALATQQFLRYAVLYSAGFKALSGLGSLFEGATDLDQSLHTIQAITQASQEGMAVIEASIKSVAAASRYSTDEIGGAAKVLAQAGVEIDKLPGILAVTTALASTTSDDLQSTAQVLTSLTEVFEKTTTAGVTSLADQVAQAVNISKLTTEGLKTIISLGASTAKMSGLKSEQFFGAAATLANKGIKDSTIATGLRETMLELFSPDDKMLKYLKDRYARIGETLSEAFIKAKFQAFQHSEDPMVAALTELKRLGVSGSGRADFNRVTDIRAQNILLPLLESLDQLSANTAKIAQGGAVARGAATQMDAFNNAMTGLGATLTSLTHELVEGVLPNLVTVIDGVKDVAEYLRTAAAEAEGGSSGAVTRSLVTGAMAGGLAFAKTPGGLVKRLAAGVSAGATAGTLDTVAHSQGPAGDALGMAAEVAITAASIASIWGQIRGRTAGAAKNIGSAAASSKEFWNKLSTVTTVAEVGISAASTNFGKLLTLFKVTHWGRLATLITLAIGAVGAAYTLLGGDDNDASVAAARAKQAKARETADKNQADFAPFKVETSGGQAESVSNANKKFNEAKAEVAKLIGAENVTANIVDQIIELGTKGIESGSVAQKEILDELRKKLDVPDDKVKALTEAGAKLSESQAALLGKVQQQSEELSAAMQAADPTPVQKAMLAAYGRMTADEQRLLTVANKSKSASEFAATQASISKFFDLVYKEMPSEASKTVEESRKEIARTLIKGAEADNRQLKDAVLSLREAANKGAVDYIKDVQVQVQAEFEKGRDSRALQTLAGETRSLLPVAQGVKDDEAQAQAEKAEAEKDRIRQEEVSTYLKGLTDAQLRKAQEEAIAGGMTGDQMIAKLRAQAQSAENQNDLETAREMTRQMYGVQKDMASMDVETALANFEKEFLVNPPPGAEQNETYKRIKGTADAQTRADLYTQDKVARELVNAGSEGLQKALIELSKAVTKARVELPSEADAADQGFRHRIANKAYSDQGSIQQSEMQDIQRRIENTRINKTLGAQAEVLAEERYRHELKEIELTKARMAESFASQKDIDAKAKAMLQVAEDNRKNLIDEGKKITLNKEKIALSKELKTANKAVGYAVETGNDTKLSDLQKRRTEIALKLLDVETKILDRDHGFASEAEKQQYLQEARTNLLSQMYDEVSNTLNNKAEREDQRYKSRVKDTPFGDEEQGFRKATGREMTRDQQSLVAQFNLYNALRQQQNLQATLAAQKDAYASATRDGNQDGMLRFEKDIVKTEQDLSDLTESIGEFRGQLHDLNATFLQGLAEVSDEGILSKFEQLNPGFRYLRDQIEGNLAGTLDGLTGIIGDFIANGFSAVHDIEALRDAMANTAQAAGQYQSVVSHRIGLLQEIKSSPTILQESQAVQTLIIEQATTAQKAAEAAARQQLAIAKLQEEQVRRENSLAGQIQKFFTESTKDLASTLLKDTMGEGIRSLFNFGQPEMKDTYEIDGSLRVHVTNMGMDLGGVQSPGQDTGAGGLWDSVSAGMGSAWDSVTGFFSGGSEPTTPVDVVGVDTSAAAGSLQRLSDTATSAAQQVAGLGGQSMNSAGQVVSLASMLNSAFQMSATVTAADSTAVEANAAAMAENTAAVMSNSAAQAAGGAASASGGGMGGMMNGMLGGGSGAGGKASSGMGSMMGWVGSIFSIVTSAASIYSTISQYQKSQEAYDEIINAAKTPQNFAPPTVDPTANAAPKASESKYPSLSDYLTPDKYQELVQSAAASVATGAVSTLTQAPAAYMGDANKFRATMTSGISTGAQQIAQATSEQQQSQAPQAQNIRIINAVDQSVVHDFMSSSSGEKVIMNVLQRNAAAIREYVR